jgi:undecaprenyl-diphosphatase
MRRWKLRERALATARRHGRSLLLLFAGIAIPLYVAASLARDVLAREPLPFDEPILTLVHAQASPALDRVMLFLSLVGLRFGVLPLAVVVAIALARRRDWNLFLFWTAAVGGAGVLNFIAKRGFGRARPDLWLSLAPETTFSFPSGHAMASMAFVAALCVLAWGRALVRWWVASIGALFVIAVGLSRVYLGVHYPSDIVAGWAASLAWVLGAHLILRRSRRGDR